MKTAASEGTEREKKTFRYHACRLQLFGRWKSHKFTYGLKTKKKYVALVNARWQLSILTVSRLDRHSLFPVKSLLKLTCLDGRHGIREEYEHEREEEIGGVALNFGGLVAEVVENGAHKETDDDLRDESDLRHVLEESPKSVVAGVRNCRRRVAHQVADARAQKGPLQENPELQGTRCRVLDGPVPVLVY